MRDNMTTLCLHEEQTNRNSKNEKHLSNVTGLNNHNMQVQKSKN